MTRPPVTQCGYPVAKRHDPWCTGRKRLIDGCWCFLRREDEPKLTARQWRAARRRNTRYMRALTRTYPELRTFERDWVRLELNRRARAAVAERINRQ